MIVRPTHLEPPKERKVLWAPQPGPQTALIECPVFEVFYGGARGGGKTDASLGDWLLHQHEYGEHATGIFFRRRQRQLSEAINRAKYLYKPLGAKFNENSATFTFPLGARLKFAYLERDSDAEEYQGHNYTRVYVEEVTNFPSPAPIFKLFATLRSAAGVPCGIRLTGNPGGPGHNWVKERYITPAEKGRKVIREKVSYTLPDGQVVETVSDRVFIPSKLTDNKKLIENDPNYIARLHQSGSPQLVRAWLNGDWSIIDGAYFTEFDEAVHVLPSMEYFNRIPHTASRFRAYDWGFAKPFSVGWYAISDGTWGLPKGAIVKYREWYGCKSANVGLRMTDELVAQGILERDGAERIRYGVADPAIFAQKGGISTAETFALKQCPWLKADNNRITGWSQVRVRLVGRPLLGAEPDLLDARLQSYNLDRYPMLYFLDSCEHLIRTLPFLQHDEKKVEDLDSEGEDHAADETRYACMSRPWDPAKPLEISNEPVGVLSPGRIGLTIRGMIERAKAKREAKEQGYV